MAKANEIADAVLRASALEHAGDEDEALDLLWGAIDGALRRGEYAAIDDALCVIDPETIGTDVIVGILSASLTGRGSLQNLQRFASIALPVLTARGIVAGDLMGLLPLPDPGR